MELEELALCTREEIEKEINKMCPYPANPKNLYEEEVVLRERVNIRQCLKRLQIEALLDGKLTVDQVLEQLYSEDDEGGIGRNSLEDAIKEVKEGGNRSDVVDRLFEYSELL